ncbi:MAG: M1 family metallopeptidase [Acidobacteria bacterium]|nr:M1 family metallopeptidase [Acidobacteriota bacterium]
MRWWLLVAGGLMPLVQASLTRPVASYTIRAELDPGRKTIRGEQALTWWNDSREWISSLRFHLYMNAFRNERSTFLRESGGRLRGFFFRPGENGWIQLHSILAGHVDLTPRAKFVQPDDGNAHDQTVLEVSLPAPVPPQGILSLEIRFETKLPRVFARAGYLRDFFLAGQWFPKIGVYEEAGEGGAAASGWNCHQYHGWSEFYADFGTYDVQITVPEGYVVGATGSLVERKSSGGKTLFRFRQEDVHDFAWAASPRFLDLRRTHRPKGGGGEVEIRLLFQPEHQGHASRHFRAVQEALDYFSSRYGEYPYPVLTVVDPPRGAGGADGMEYPTFIAAGSDWLNPKELLLTEYLVLHEFGHQYWYGMVANNEFEDAWLDEGINSYSTGKALEEAYGPSAVPLWLDPPLVVDRVAVSSPVLARALYLALPHRDPIAKAAWEFQGFASYGVGTYAKPELMLRSLESLLGPPTFSGLLREFFQRWRFRHPTTEDFVAVAEEVAGRELAWFFDQYLRGTETVDYRIRSLNSRLEENSRDYRSEVVVDRMGGATFPVEILLVFEDGKRLIQAWDGKDRWRRFHFVRPARLRSAEVDPGRKNWFDRDFTNNSRRLRGDSRAGWRWSLRFLFWIQNVLQWAAAIA